MSLYLSNLSFEDIQKERDEVLRVKVEDIKALAHPVRAALEQGNICIVGNEDKIQEAKDLFKNIVFGNELEPLEIPSCIVSTGLVLIVQLPK